MLEALKESFIKLSPAKMFRNPVMFTVWVGTLVMAGVCVWIGMGELRQGGLTYNIVITAVLFITLMFANFAPRVAGETLTIAHRAPARVEWMIVL